MNGWSSPFGAECTAGRADLEPDSFVLSAWPGGRGKRVGLSHLYTSSILGLSRALSAPSQNSTSRNGPPGPVTVPRDCHFGHSPSCCQPSLVVAENRLCPSYATLGFSSVRGVPRYTACSARAVHARQTEAEQLAQNAHVLSLGVIVGGPANGLHGVTGSSSAWNIEESRDKLAN